MTTTRFAAQVFAASLTNPAKQVVIMITMDVKNFGGVDRAKIVKDKTFIAKPSVLKDIQEQLLKLFTIGEIQIVKLITAGVDNSRKDNFFGPADVVLEAEEGLFYKL